MSIQTDLTRIKNAKATIKAYIEGNGLTVPSGTLLDGMAAMLESIEAGGGGVRVEQGSVTFAEEQISYSFVTDSPDIFIAYIEDDSKPQYHSSQYVWVMIQDTRLFDQYGQMVKTSYIFGYNKGSNKYYTPANPGATGIGRFIASDFNSKLGTKTYKWYAIYGVTAT